MYKVESRVLKGMGEPLCNLIRHTMINRNKSWRMIAFNLPEINLLTADNSIVESMPLISSRLTKVKFHVNDTTNRPHVITARFRHKLTAGDLETNLTNNIVVDPACRDEVLLNSISDEEIEIQILARYGSGTYSPDENRNFVDRANSSSQDYYIIGTNHSSVANFTFKIESGVGEYDTAKMTFTSSSTISEQDLLTESLKSIAEVLKDVAQQNR